MNYIIKQFETKEAIQYPWRVIGTGFVPIKIENDGDDYYPIEVYSDYGSISYTKSGSERPDQKHPVIFLLDIEAMQKHGYPIPDFVLEKEPELKQSVTVNSQNMNNKQTMNNQELEHKFNLIGDPIVRAVVRHLYNAEFRPLEMKEAKTARQVFLNAFDWINQSLYLYFWDKLDDNLQGIPNYSFTPEELQQVKESYPELFNADGSLKESDNKGVWRDVYDSSEQKAVDTTTNPELNRNEIALKIYIALNGNANTQYVTTDFDELVKKSYQAADEFIKHSHEINNNK